MAATTSSDTTSPASPWAAEAQAYARAFGGAFLFGLPLLFTMEMWWIGEYLSRPRLLAFIGAAFLVNVSLSYSAGFRRGDCTVADAVAEALEAMGVGLVVAFVMLLAMNRIQIGDSLDGVLGVIALQAIPLGIGASVASAVFSSDDGRAGTSKKQHDPWAELRNDVGATFAGAIFLGFAIAPTEEVPMLATGIEFPHALGLIALTMLATYLIVFASGFDPEHRDRVDGGLFQRPFSETMLAYTVSLAAAALLLLMFAQISWGDPLHSVLQEVLVLGVPAAIGGAAGRIIT